MARQRSSVIERKTVNVSLQKNKSSLVWQLKGIEKNKTSKEGQTGKKIDFDSMMSRNQHYSSQCTACTDVKIVQTSSDTEDSGNVREVG